MRPIILCISSSYPKSPGDPNGVFVHELNKELLPYSEPIVISPLFKGGAKEEYIDNIKIYRHKQFIFNNIQLAYGTDILVKLRNNFLYYFVVPFFLTYQLFLIKKVIKRKDIKIIHAYWIIPGAFLAAVYKRYFNNDIKIVATLLGADIWSFNKGWKRNLLKFTFKYIDIVTSQSLQLGQELSELGYKGKLFHYPIGIDVTKFSPKKIDINIKERFNIKGKMLLFVGSLIERKGIKYLISSMPFVVENFPETKLIIIGSGDLQESMLKLTQDLNIAEHIIFTGNILNHDLPPYFATADIFILPSLSEGFPLVVMEALSSGTISIVSDLPVFKSLDNDKQFLITIEKRNITKLAKAIVQVLSQKEVFIKSKIEARNYALENFNIKKSAVSYSSVYQSLLNHTRSNK